LVWALEAVVIDPEVREEDLARKVIERAGPVPVRFEGADEVRRLYSGLPLSRGKRILFLTRYAGDMVKPCPGTRAPYLCCRYQVINQMLHCPMDCAYCILQEYLDVPVMTAFTNLGDAYRQIDRILADNPRRFFRFGTGELSDSLALDPLLTLSAEWIRFFSGKKNVLIELKTKSASIGSLPAGGARNAVISWSLNPSQVIRQEEKGSSSLDARLKAARRCQDRGYLLGFHFDPVLWIPGWKEEYGALMDMLFRSVDAGRIAWISLGCLRFPPELKETMIRRFPETSIPYQEMVRCEDGKMRYPRPKRIEMYRLAYGKLKSWSPDLFVYFCMESPEVWNSVTGWHPGSSADLDFRFASSLFERFPELEMDRPSRKAYAD